VTRRAEHFTVEDLLGYFDGELLPSRQSPMRAVISNPNLPVEPAEPVPGERSDHVAFPSSMTKKLPRYGAGPVIQAYPEVTRQRLQSKRRPGIEEEWIVASGNGIPKTDPTVMRDLDIRFANAGVTVEKILAFVKHRGMPSIDLDKVPMNAAAGIRLAVFQHASARLRFLVEVADALVNDRRTFFARYRGLFKRLVVHYQWALVSLDFLAPEGWPAQPVGKEFGAYLERLAAECERDPRHAASLLLCLQFTYYGQPWKAYGYEDEGQIGVITCETAAGFLELVYTRLLERLRLHKKLARCKHCQRVFEKPGRSDREYCPDRPCASAERKANERRKKRLERGE